MIFKQYIKKNGITFIETKLLGIFWVAKRNLQVCLSKGKFRISTKQIVLKIPGVSKKSKPSDVTITLLTLPENKSVGPPSALKKSRIQHLAINCNITLTTTTIVNLHRLILGYMLSYWIFRSSTSTICNFSKVTLSHSNVQIFANVCTLVTNLTSNFG